METLRIVIAFFALLTGIVCSILFFCDTWATIANKRESNAVKKKASDVLGADAVKEGVVEKSFASITDITGLVNALAGLTTSLSKVGPALLSLIGAIMFYFIASISSGVLKTEPTTSSNCTAKSNQCAVTEQTKGDQTSGETPIE